MADDIIRADIWNVQNVDGLPRVTAKELALRLKYNVKRITAINEKIESLLEDGKLNDIDVTRVRAHRKRGFSSLETHDYWLTLRGAILVALHVRTRPADGIRLRVVESLEELSVKMSTQLANQGSSSLALEGIGQELAR